MTDGSCWPTSGGTGRPEHGDESGTRSSAHRDPANTAPGTPANATGPRRPLRNAPGLPTLIPGPLAAQEVGVAPATIRKWVQLGRLSPAGKAGRAQLFRLEDVFAAERAARGTERRAR